MDAKLTQGGQRYTVKNRYSGPSDECNLEVFQLQAESVECTQLRLISTQF